MAEYEAGPYKGFGEEVENAFAAIVPDDADVLGGWLTRIVEIVDTPFDKHVPSACTTTRPKTAPMSASRCSTRLRAEMLHRRRPVGSPEAGSAELEMPSERGRGRVQTRPHRWRIRLARESRRRLIIHKVKTKEGRREAVFDDTPILNPNNRLPYDFHGHDPLRPLYVDTAVSFAHIAAIRRGLGERIRSTLCCRSRSAL